jgi:hypothetical protein
MKFKDNISVCITLVSVWVTDTSSYIFTTHPYSNITEAINVAFNIALT